MKKLVLFSIGLILITLFVIIQLFQDTVVTFLEENASTEVAQAVRRVLFIPDKKEPEPIIVEQIKPDSLRIDDFPEEIVDIDTVAIEEPVIEASLPVPAAPEKEKKKPMVEEKIEPVPVKEEKVATEDVFGNSSFTESFFDEESAEVPVKEEINKAVPATYVLAVTNGEQRAYHNGVVSFRTHSDVVVEGLTIPRNSLFRALAKIEDNKLYLFVSEVSIKNRTHLVDMEGVDKDLVKGINFNEDDIRESKDQLYVGLPDNFQINFQFVKIRH